MFLEIKHNRTAVVLILCRDEVGCDVFRSCFVGKKFSHLKYLAFDWSKQLGAKLYVVM